MQKKKLAVETGNKAQFAYDYDALLALLAVIQAMLQSYSGGSAQSLCTPRSVCIMAMAPFVEFGCLQK